MFRKMRRFKQQVSTEECIEILRKAPRGVLAVLGDEDYPYAFPVNFIYNEDDGKIYFHCAKQGHKLDAVRKHDKVSFCVYNEGFRKENDWALNITSVVIFGRIKEIEDVEKTYTMVKKLGMKYYPTVDGVEETFKQTARNVLGLELTIDHMTGKLVNES